MLALPALIVAECNPTPTRSAARERRAALDVRQIGEDSTTTLFGDMPAFQTERDRFRG